MKTVLRHGLSIVFLIGLFMAAHKYLSWNLMREAWSKFSWGAVGLLLVLPALYLLLKGWRFVLLMRSAVPEVPDSVVLRGYVASQSASLLPGGFAMRAAILGQAGVPVERAVGPVLANSGIDQFVLLVAGLFLAYWYQGVRTAALVLTVVLALLIAVMVVKRSREWISGLLRGVAERFGKKQKVKEFEDACWSMVDGKLFASTFALSVAADLVSYAILCIVVGALGLKVEYWPLAAAFVIPTLLGRLSPLPAGAGVTEAGMIAFIANKTAMSTNEAAAATALMRSFDVVLPALYGALVYFLGWKGKEEDAGGSEPAAAVS